MEKLVLENEYEFVVPLFGAAFAAPNKGIAILYWGLNEIYVWFRLPTVPI